MENTQISSALGSRPHKQLDALETFAPSVKPDVKPTSQAELLEELLDAELKQLQRYESMILKTASPSSRFYYQQAKQIYQAIGETSTYYLRQSFKT